jgi:septum site-determining protein MinC
MTADLPLSNSNSIPSISLVDCDLQVRIKSEGDKVVIILPPADSNTTVTDWSEIWESLQSRVNSNEKSWSDGTSVHLVVKDRLLDARQLQMIEESLQDANLQLKKVITSRRQTAVASVMAGYSVEQESPNELLIPRTEEEEEEETAQLQNLVEPLYYQNTVRSGVEVRHPGTIIIFGDVNPGGIISSAGDILVWGSLRGIAHAGAQGNRKCRILALKMQPTQLRIADAIARPPEAPLNHYEPEIAYMGTEGIRISPSEHFNKNFSFSIEVNAWVED